MIRRLASHPWARRIFIAACLVIIAVQTVIVAHRRQTHLGDFDVSREMGRRFLAGEYLYAGGLHYPYTPTAAMSFAPLALVEPGVGLALRYATAVAGLWLTLRLLRAMLWRGRRVDATAVFGVEVVTLILAAQYIIRDLDDGGPHLLLLTILVGGMYCVSRGREALGGVWFGLATVLKAPAGLLLPFLLWKRKWKPAGMMLAAAILWTVLPMTWMGYADWWSHEEEWTRTAFRSVLGNPTPGVQASEQRIQNQALKPVVTRSLAAYPDPNVGRWVATAVVVVLLLLCAWLMRERYRGAADPAWLMEGSAVLILALLLSPVTWAQHIVFIVPALYLILTEESAVRPLGVAASVAMAAYLVPALLLNREIVGKDLNLLFLSYGMHTLALLLVLGVVLLRRPTVE